MSFIKRRFESNHLTYYNTKMVKIMSNPEANCTMPASVVVESSPAGAVEVVSTGGSVPSRIQIYFQFLGKTN